MITDSSFHGDVRVLISMKEGMADSSHLLDSWSVSNHTTYCSWAGVQCDHVGQVVALHLSYMSISGPFPTEVTNLQALRFLNISNNFLTGSLPSNISKLKNLKVLDVFYNNLSGALPLDVSYLAKLNHLELGGNFFSGSIPCEYGNFTNLEYLSLYENSLNGRIPRELGNLVNLKKLYLGYYNVFDGDIPVEIGNLSKLVELDMSGCGLTGALPSQLGGLKNLAAMYLYDNSITGRIPPELGNLTSLRCMDLSNNSLSGQIPMQLSELKELKELYLSSNILHGEIPPFIGDLPYLEDLNLWGNNFTGQVPQQLGMSGKLVEMDISNNKLTGSIPHSLCEGGRLEILTVENNLFFGPIPYSLGKCNSLHMVLMQKNYLNGSIPAGLLYLPMLTVIQLQNNYLSGSISEQINVVSSMLLRLDVSNNHLSGSLPSSIGKLSALRMLLIHGNRLRGNLPPEIGRLMDISTIDFSKNRFNGMIPREISNCTLLESIDLSQNEFTGPIPVEISRMKNLNHLNVSRNHLNESIPREFGKKMIYADFSYNNFSGLVTDSSLFYFVNVSGNPYLCGAHSRSCRSRHTKVGLLLALLAFGLVIFSSLALACLAAVNKARTVRKEDDGRSWQMTTFQKVNFGTDDVLKCIKENTIGRGGAGVVYRGIMPDGEQIAVKKLTSIGTFNGRANDYGFSAEISTLGKIRHRHIVRLLAFCSNHDANLLVYEYMPNGNLTELLHGNNGRHLDWDNRYKLAVEAAEGLCYLHHDCQPSIIHRDVKSSNILLDSNFEAHVADFGLAKFLHHSGTLERTTSIPGSFGYIAPEYLYTLKLDEKSDVYSFGVVLLELITGKEAVGECEFEEGMNITGWVKKMTNWKREEVKKIIDPRLSSIPMREAMHIFFVALLCTQEQPVDRPTMREIVQMFTYFLYMKLMSMSMD
eukprot:PITA_11287